jgi:hypothetical protein
LLILTVATAGLLLFGIWRRQADTTVLAVAVAVVAGLAWDRHIGASNGRPGGWIGQMLTGRPCRTGRMSKPGGGRMRTIDELRAEYGQTVLDDASWDPVLDRLLDQYAAAAAAQLRKAAPSLAGHRYVDVVVVTGYANGRLDAMSDPGRRPSGRRYRGYTDDMLTIAALCRLADTLSIPAAEPR